MSEVERATLGEDGLSRRVLMLALTVGALAPGCAEARTGQPDMARRGRLVSSPPVSVSAGISQESAGGLYGQSGPFTVEIVDGEWSDASRGGRTVAWRAYLPASGSGPAPAMVFSPGAGGDRTTGAIFGSQLASHGVASLHLTHVGFDRIAFRANAQAIGAAARDPALAVERFEDIGFVLSNLRAAVGGLSSRIDGSRLGIGGHSFGAITSQIAAGQFVNGFGQRFAQPTLRAAMLLSPSPPRRGYGAVETAFAQMLMPMLHMTGTEDDAPNGDFPAVERRVPFDRSEGVLQHLVVLSGANHFTFGGAQNPSLRGQNFGYPGLARHHGLIKTAITAWWRAMLLDDLAARQFLGSGGYAALLDPGDTFETKN